MGWAARAARQAAAAQGIEWRGVEVTHSRQNHIAKKMSADYEKRRNAEALPVVQTMGAVVRGVTDPETRAEFERRISRGQK